MLEVNGVRLFYDVRDQGEPVALLNGISQNTGGWSAQTAVLERTHQVILHDMRGQWASDKPDQQYTFDMHVEDFRALLDHLGIDKTHVVGISYGAEVGMLFAVKYPERVLSLVVGTATSEITPLIRAWAECWAVASETRCGYKFLKLFAPSVYSNALYGRAGAWVEKRAREFDEKVSPEWFVGFGRLLECFLTLDLTARLKEIQAPTLVLAAQHDALKPVSQSVIIAESIPDAELLIIGNSGHVAIWEKPQEFNTAVLGFLAKHARPS